MQLRRILGIAALGLGTTLAACSDTTAPSAQKSSDPLVQRLNQLANGAGQVTSVRSQDKSAAGITRREGGNALEPKMAVREPCYYDVPCDDEPIDPNCYDYCAWFDVAAGVSNGTYSSGEKWADLWGELYAYSAARAGTLWISFQSAGGCTNYTGQFDAATLTGSSGPYTLSTYRWVIYSGGTFSWRVYADGEVANQYGRYGYESAYDATCY